MVYWLNMRKDCLESLLVFSVNEIERDLLLFHMKLKLVQDLVAFVTISKPGIKATANQNNAMT